MNKWFILLVTTGTALLAGFDKPTGETAKMASLIPSGSPGALEKRLDSRYEMRVMTTPARPVPGQPTLLRFRPTRLTDVDEAVTLQPVHGKDINAFIASADLSWGRFIRCEAEPARVYRAETVLPAEGPYMLFAEYHPRAGKTRVERIDLRAGTGSSALQPWARRVQTQAMAGDYTVSIEPQSKYILAGRTNTILLNIRRGAQPVSAAAPSIDARLAVVREGGVSFACGVAECEEGVIGIEVPFGKPGLYRAFLQFQIGEEVHTADFTLEARASGPVPLHGADASAAR
jgi:hypothetical protein